MTPRDMQEMIVNRLIRTVGKNRQHWRRAIGEIQVYAMATHPHCNWDVRPTGSVADVQAVNDAVDAVRMMHPHVTMRG